MFRAPVRDGSGGFTPAVLISRPGTSGAARTPTRKPVDAALLLPAFGLLFCGVAGLVVNGVLSYQFLTDPAGAKQYIRNQLPALRDAGVGADDPPAERDRIDDERAETAARAMRWVLPLFMVVSGVVFAGGLAMATRRSYRLAQVGCVAAMLNIPHFCCLPGSIAGLWGLLMLGSEEAREQFAR